MNQTRQAEPTDKFGLRQAAAAILLRDEALRRRFAYYLARTGGMSRRARRALQKRAALSAAALALLLALGRGPVATAAPEATIVVADGAVGIAADGKCSLIEAFVNANKTTAGAAHADCTAGATSGADTIQLPPNGRFTLDASNNESYYGNNGLPRITSTIIVQGNGSVIERAESAPEFRFFEVARRTGDLTLRDVTLSGGLSEVYYGGAIYTRGNLTVIDSTLSDNQASSGGAIAAYKANIAIENSTLSGNRSEQIGGAVSVFYGRIDATDTVFSENYTTGGGGSIYSYNAPVTVSGSTFDANFADSGAGVNVQNSNVTITGSRFTGNESYYATAIYVNGYERGTVVVRDVTISDNTAESAAAMAIKNMDLTIDRSTISGNTSSTQFGAIYLYYSGATIINSTVSGNSGSYGGGLHVIYGYTTLINSTIANNTAVETGGGINIQYSSGLRLIRSVLSGNAAANGSQVYAPDAVVTANGFNVIGNSGEAGVVGFTPGANDIVPDEAIGDILLPLADNGGSTETHALARTSPAIDVAPTAACAPAPVNGIDQRGEPRGRDGDDSPSANECDAGAFETVYTPGPVSFEILLPFIKR